MHIYPTLVGRRLAGLLLCCILPAALDGQEVFKPVDPDSVGFKSEVLTQLDEKFQTEVDEGRIVGCLALVARGDQVAYVKSFGQRDQAKEEAMTEDTIFRIYSMSKPITSVAVMMLVEEGKLELDAPAARYLPEFENLKVIVRAKNEDGQLEDQEIAPDRQPTVRDFLRHTSGMTYGFFGDTDIDMRYRRAGILGGKNLAEMITKLSTIPLLYQPGERFHYSVSTDVLGRLVEVASGERFDRFLQQEIFGPLKMEDTSFIVPAEKRDRLAEMYTPGRDGLRPAGRMRSARFISDHEFFSGGGGLCSTTQDYLRFCQMLVNGGELNGTRLLEEDTVKQMTTNQLPGNGRFKFGLGFAISPQGDFSWGGAAGTRFWINPEKNVIGIFMVQINPYQAPNYIEQMKSVVYEALED